MEPRTQQAGADEVWTIRRVLEWTTDYLKKQGSETPRLDAEILLAHSRDCERIQLYTHFNDALSEEPRARMRDLVRRRAQAEPVAYLVGHREFYALDFRVTPDVLIPRPDTETLVMELLEAAKELSEPRILDVGTGSGCIAISTAVNCPRAKLTATDVSPAALEVAKENAEKHGVADRIAFREGDLWDALRSGERFHIIAGNPPYVSEEEFATLQADVRLHEPRSALVGGPGSGLEIVKRLIAGAGEHLEPGGRLFLEISPEQAQAVRELLEAQKTYEEIRVLKDLAGRERVAQARKKG